MTIEAQLDKIIALIEGYISKLPTLVGGAMKIPTPEHEIAAAIDAIAPAPTDIPAADPKPPRKPRAAKPVEVPPPVAAVAAPLSPVEEDDFLSDKPQTAVAKKYTVEDVKAALVGLQSTHGSQVAKDILKNVGGSVILSTLAEAKFAAVIHAAEEAAASPLQSAA